MDTGALLDVVDGRGKVVTTWLAARPRWWRRRVRLVAIDMSSEFRAAVRRALPKARISVDHWHVVRLANEMVTKVRRRRVWELHQRRGRIADIPWKNRKLLAARDTPTFQRECARLEPAVKATRLPEPVALFKTLTAWRRELLTFLPHEG